MGGSPDLLPYPGTLVVLDCKKDAHRGRRLLRCAEEELYMFLSRYSLHRVFPRSEKQATKALSAIRFVGPVSDLPCGQCECHRS